MLLPRTDTYQKKILRICTAIAVLITLCCYLVTPTTGEMVNARVAIDSDISLEDDTPRYITVMFDQVTDESWFASQPSTETFQRRNQQQYPFVSMDYFISKANTVLDVEHFNMDTISVTTYLRHQHDLFGRKPIIGIFLPSEYLYQFLPSILNLTVTFSFITVSNQPICVPYITYPPLAEDIPRLNTTFNDIDALLTSPYLDKWFTKNPCIKHPKIHPLPVGPKWQWSSQRFLDDDSEVSALSQIYRRYGLKPFAMAHNYSHLLYDTSHSHFLFKSRNNKFYLDTKLDNGSPDIPILHDIDMSMIKDASQFAQYVERQIASNSKSWFLKMDTHMFPGKDRLLYFNFFANNTDKPLYRPHANTRRLAYDSLIGQGFQPSPVRQINGYLQDLSEHKFCISPPGVGLDAHRTWEALMVGTIPIVLSSPMDTLYDDLPVVIVSSFDVITEESLDALYKSVRANIEVFDFSKLYVHYWDKVIN